MLRGDDYELESCVTYCRVVACSLFRDLLSFTFDFEGPIGFGLGNFALYLTVI